MVKHPSYDTPDYKRKISSLEDIDLSSTYSYAHYLTWLFDERVELIKGKVFPMTGPARIHQQVSVYIASMLFNFFEGKLCKVYTAPFDVRFYKGSKADKDIYTVLQPDICIICDPRKLDDRGCIGAPDIVIEILSPGNNGKELLNKYNIYEEYEVKEYWIVSPDQKTFMKYILDANSKYLPSRLFTLSEKVGSDLLPGFELDLDRVFDD